MTGTNDVSMTLAQHNAFNGNVAAAGAGANGEKITLTTAGTATGLAAVENYVLADGINTFSFAAATAQSVTTTGTGLDTIKSTLANAGNVATTVTLGADVEDDVVDIINTSLDAGASVTTVNGFVAASDGIKFSNTATGATAGGGGKFITATVTENKAIDVGNGSIIELTGVNLTDLTADANGAAIETAIITAIDTIANGSYLVAIDDNAGNIGLYDLFTSANGNAATTGNIAIELIGILNGVIDGALAAGNFV